MRFTGKIDPQFGDGSTRRDYTYIDDIVQGVMGSLH
jgi:UDP-glucuronate 4-epimerase